MAWQLLAVNAVVKLEFIYLFKIESHGIHQMLWATQVAHNFRQCAKVHFDAFLDGMGIMFRYMRTRLM